MDFGFIITRHVNSEKTNRYWNRCIVCIRRFYPLKKIIVIDDNSNQEFIKANFDYKNVEYINSEYPARGELLPFVYFLKNKFFENAVIIHDSIFFHKRIHFEKINVPVLPLWHFNSDNTDKDNVLRIISYLNNSNTIKNFYDENKFVINLISKNKWYGVFGVQTYINHNFLKLIQNKYNITNLTNIVRCRLDRCCLERIMAIIFYLEFPKLNLQKSILGNIMKYHSRSYLYNYDDYINDLKNKEPIKYVVKVWTGR